MKSDKPIFSVFEKNVIKLKMNTLQAELKELKNLTYTKRFANNINNKDYKASINLIISELDYLVNHIV